MTKSSLPDTKVLFVSNLDWALYNFHLPIARALRDRGCDVVLVCPRGEYSVQLEAEGYRLLHWDLRRPSLNPVTEAKAVKQLVRLYRRERPDAVHHFTIKANLYGTFAARRTGIPIIVNSWEGLGFAFTSSPRAKLLRAFLLPLMRRVLRTGKLSTIFLNEDDLQLFLRLRLIGPDRISLIPGVGVDTNNFKLSGTPNPESPVVLMGSRLLLDKGVGEFVEAARLLRQKGVKARFWLCGAPDRGNPNFVPDRILDGWRQEASVELLGHRLDMADLLRQANIVVLPTYYPEGVPRILMEGAATGLPLVATDVPGCRVVVRDGVNGFLVPPKDVTALAEAIRHLLEDETLRKRFGQASRRIAVEEFSTSVVVGKYLETYRQAGILGQAVGHG